jgi:ADP-heptose:LPS heptosyltransferase
MRTKLQLLLDKSIGSILNLLLYGFVRIVGKLLRIDHGLNSDFERIVICKFKGMGSIVQASALISTLKKNYPNADIRFVSTKANAGILTYYKKEINSVFLVDDSGLFKLISSTLMTLFKLWKFRPQVYIDLEIYSNYSTLLCTLSAAKNRLGFYKSDKNYRTGLFTHLMYYNIKTPLSEIYLQMARIMGVKEEDHSLINLEVQSNTLNSLSQKYFINDNYIVINPNASDLRLERRWPASSFVKLISEFHSNFPNYKIYLIGNKQESNYVSEIYTSFQTNEFVVNTAGNLNLNELVALLKQATLIITNDTGPLHLALALRKSTIGLFGPCSPEQYGQMETCLPVYQNVYCSPCVHEFINPPCAGDNQCMKQIEVSKVFISIKQILNESTISLKKTNSLYKIEDKVLGFVYNR